VAVTLAHGVARRVALLPPLATDPTSRWRLDVDELEAAITAATRLIIVNTPHNPTGTVLDDQELAAIARLCLEHDLIAVTDEVYEHLIYEGTHRPLATFPGMRERTVTADHDELTKNREGGLHHRRIQARAEDSWERNAEQVAEQVEAEARKQNPELVLLTGDVRMVALVRESVNEQTAALLHVLESGGRAEGVHEEAFQEEVHRVFAQHRLRRREDVVDRYHAQEGRDAAVVVGVGDVLEALRRGQVEEVLVTESTMRANSPLATRQVWVGPEAVQVGADADEVRALGVDEPEQVGADVALGRLVLATDAGVTVIDDAALDVPDEVAALLRWDDDSTPAQSGYTMSRDISEGRRRSTPA